ncbi:class I SAM-dependent methyltransferase [Trichothermofontia sichuanensis B231]|uniref:class I SAM-dependent DNA methyltransferase n=1 Tax=Trichothermofontia sichuanensis TaxID=3045816 RepID=UPI00224836CF|nr:class I SAM-dependent methyltransferase [Trichothermofontia sichuanensis]UZQ55230.1 class I SAM-dependent methyltransferase [Trichothermofontia sichuanensis B231]
MTVFGQYARYYDLLYQDKDYQKESDFIIELLKEYAPHAKNLLELGCGTGRHAEYLLKAGYQITGVEKSADMLKICQQRQQRLSPDLKSLLEITEGDLRTIRIGKKFDAVLALFHVISYQSTNDDLLAAFTTVHEHLEPGGIFIFDVWYGPAVLSERPVPRIKQILSNNLSLTRFADPKLYPNTNYVDIYYQLYVQDKTTQACKSIEEVHRMRYFFRPEIDLILKRYGLILLDSREWMSRRELGFDTWNAYWVVQNG